MHGRIRKALMLASFLMPAFVSGASVEWRSVYPRQPGTGSFPAFSNALETADGGYILQGVTANDELLMSIDGNGKQRWLSRVRRSDGAYIWYTPKPLRVTRNGLVAMWEGGRSSASNWLPQYSVVRYGETGSVERRVELGEVFGNDLGRLEVSSGGDLLMETAEFLPLESSYMLFAGKRRMGAGSDWKIQLMAAGFLDLVGAYELAGDRSLFAVNRIGVSADTLRLWAFDDAGVRIWDAAIPTGAKPAFAAEFRVVQWSAFAQAGDGRIVAAGIAEALRTNNLDAEDTLALGVVNAQGKPGWVKRFPIVKSGKAGFCSLGEVSATASGNIHVHIDCSGVAADLECDWDGALVTATEHILAPRNVPSRGLARMKNGSFIAFGSSLDSLPHVPVVDTHRVATAIGYPSLFAEPGPGGGEWKPIRLQDYGDTVFSWKYAIPGDESGAHIWDSGPPGFRFLLPTSDGGALAGGSLWTLNAQDTVSFAVLKLAPGYAVGLAPPRSSLRPASVVPGGAGAFDVLGRSRRKSVPLAGIFLTRPASAPRPAKP